MKHKVTEYELVSHEKRVSSICYEDVFCFSKNLELPYLAGLFVGLEEQGFVISKINIHYTHDEALFLMPLAFEGCKSFVAAVAEEIHEAKWIETVSLVFFYGKTEVYGHIYPAGSPLPTFRVSVSSKVPYAEYVEISEKTTKVFSSPVKELAQIMDMRTEENNSGSAAISPEELVNLAKEAMTHAYVPYSGYKVGAALLCADGTVYQGCNIENAAYGPTICAERTAIFKAVYDGHRDFVAIAVCGGKDGIITGGFPPCGVCRQVMREFCEDDFLIYMVDEKGFEKHTLAQILPFSFSAKKHMG